MIAPVFDLLFGSGRNVVRDTVEVFSQNAEGAARRDQARLEAALAQHGLEFRDRRSRFDRVMDAINRLPRPALALGTLGLFGAAMVDPVWFAARMQGIALVPDPLWWLLGAIVSFYFGARHQAKSQGFQRDVARTLAQLPGVTRNLRALETGAGATASEVEGRAGTDPNPAIVDWQRARDER
ncbi:holin family protein [Pseudooceanicola aestuarii]|uniref:holin family protein n=1 Tax=Pseudooceanicola aestuarii TaxID=2697319 RepID=UPI0013D682C3|nr:holin family protein [Pseudooceanicola aestuarii]